MGAGGGWLGEAGWGRLAGGGWLGEAGWGRLAGGDWLGETGWGRLAGGDYTQIFWACHFASSRTVILTY